MNKLEVGMYVKTIFGEIGKIEKYCGTNSCGDLWKLDIKENAYNYKNILFSSYNIIDLIEVGDIITYEYPMALGIVTHENVKVSQELLDILKNGENNHEYQIKSIVTKEQFEGLKYEIK